MKIIFIFMSHHREGSAAPRIGNGIRIQRRAWACPAVERYGMREAAGSSGPLWM